ncbi:XRE family transcriptional regulator [Kibdelosporangium philippinense]|uniref:XRE family transcriptional regulator n=1 Tax=Kibdelosporangium philippinense TaxID=211113 RepID=A0ABS8ZV67_9PSEU|nr:XRE family transcriptional regulator [Kibdelosporangium philippinense]MCE7011625.1 XRE family transcriptional regulator [Kibdelosporangium philippinense]
MHPDASAAARAFAPARLTMARELAGWLKRDLAEAIDRTAAAISQYELGQSRPSAETLSRCADALAVPVSFFTVGRPQLHLDTAQAHFRSLRATTATQRQQALAHVELLWEVVEQLDRVIELPPLDVGIPMGIPHGDPATTARMVRKAWSIYSGPTAHLVRNLEARGVVTTRIPALDCDTIDAFSSALHGRPIIALTYKGNPMRQRFSVAHELGHLLLHPEPVPGSVQNEREANAFAAEFLMPANEISDQLPTPVDVAALKQLADNYGVSTAALIYRGKDLGVYSESTLRRVLATLTKLGWRTHEPVNSGYPGEQPELLRLAIELAGANDLTMPALALRLHIGLPRLRALVGLSDVRPKLRLIHGAG